MTAETDLSFEPRPRDFAARFSRARPMSLARSRRKRPKGTFAVALAAIIALPAFAQPGQWDRFAIGDADDDQIVIESMPFEKAGSSFPGSAFYYLDLHEEPAPKLGEGIRSDAAIDFPQERLDPGPIARALRIDNSGIDRTRALQCLTAAIYYEARSEPDSGQRSVAQVVLNRVAHSSYPNTVCGVVYQGSSRRTGCQFSFTCDGSLARKPGRMFWDRAQSVALAALGGYVHSAAGLATHYHTVQIYPYWAPSLNYLGTIGAHRFYRFKGKAGTSRAFSFAYRGGEPTARAVRTSAVAMQSSKALNPALLQEQFDLHYRQAKANTEAEAIKPAPPPVYTSELRERGGDTLYSGENLPDATGIREEYRNSGKWIAKPGA